MFELALPEWGPHLLLIFLHYKCPPTQKSLQNKEAYYWSVLQMIKVHQIWAQCEICKGKFFANRSPSGSILHCGKSNWNFGHILQINSKYDRILTLHNHCFWYAAQLLQPIVYTPVSIRYKIIWFTNIIIQYQSKFGHTYF